MYYSVNVFANFSTGILEGFFDSWWNGTGKLQKNVPSSKDKISHSKFLMVKLMATYVRILKSTKLKTESS